VSPKDGYRIVKVASGVHSIHSLGYAETFHPVIGPIAEAETLYVRQLRLVERLLKHAGEFVIWDVGLGAAANVIAVLQATEELPCSLRIISFDNTLAPLEFGLQNTKYLDYLSGYKPFLHSLLVDRQVTFCRREQKVCWEVHLADFPGLLNEEAAREFAKPHVVMFDAFSPAKNPTMWTQPLFARLFKLLAPSRPCALPTYSRSTMLRTTLLLAGFFVGVGHASGQKEETTIAANDLELIEEPLNRGWLERARRSASAEPMWEPFYRQARLRPDTWLDLRQHPQFKRTGEAA
jgi:hypothetical protein